MAGLSFKRKLSYSKKVREKQRELREDGNERAIVIPVVIRPVIVGIELRAIVVAVSVEQVRIAIGTVQDISPATAR